MSIATNADWRGMRAVGDAVARVLALLERDAAPGISPRELDRRAAGLVAALGATSAPADTYGFPGTVLISVNDAVVHGIPRSRPLRDGDLVKFDVTLRKDGYVADAARSVVIGDGAPIARRLKACAEAAFARAMAVARPGVLVRDVGAAIHDEVRQHGFDIIPELGGHGVGRHIHEEPFVWNYRHRRDRTRLTEGLVLAIEPIVCAGQPAVVTSTDGWTLRTRDGSLAAHHEQTVVITAGMPVVLTRTNP
jgi:methionyl aminopeptidase